MKPFWTYAKRMLDYRRLLALTLVVALLDASVAFAGFGTLMGVIEVMFGAGSDAESANARRIIAEKAEPLLEMVRDSPLDALAHLGDSVISMIPTDPFHGFLFFMGVILVLALIGTALRFTYQYGAITLTFRTVMVIRKEAFHHLVHTPLILALTEGTADQLSRVIRDTGQLSAGFNALLGRGLRDILIGFVCLLVALTIDWRLTLLFLIGAPLIAIIIRKFGKKIRKAARRANREYGNMVGAVQETLQALRVVKVHQAEGYERRRFNAVNRRVWTQEMRARIVKALSSPVVELIAMIGVVSVASVAAYWVFRSNSEPTDLLQVLVMLGLAGASLKQVASLNNKVQNAAAAADRLAEIFEQPVEPTARGQFDRQLPPLPRHRETVEFQNVIFTYPNTTDPALREIDLTAQLGQVVAIVGGNGSGKSTLLGLIPRLYDADAGRILIDGHNIYDHSLRSLRRQMAMVTQDTVLFDGTIAENITYGQRHISRERMIEAAIQAGADEFVQNLPASYDTQVGEWGARLSGGQRQRIAIARAILRDPAILLLDEATSQIDSDSEVRINLALDQLRHGRTTFVVAHRLSTVRTADQILVMHNGSVIDRGRHDELNERCAVYRKLAQTQLMPMSSLDDPEQPTP